ncbi:protein kinase domain-containing protein [Solimonas soli]|uniref:protein kinase domain-containing protein n=1 Tax=Solimonas soli TaxID=413479 RepID=UPI0004BAC012|nr:winged helix-turn-helix domain-containing protein [Solimonas soli]
MSRHRSAESSAPGAAEARISIWRFAAAEFDEGSWQLTVGGEPVDLEPRPLQILQHLLRCAGEVVRKDELISAVYGHSHITDGALHSAIKKLRTALRDDAGAIIVTVHRVGYKLAAIVHRQTLGVRQAGLPALAAGEPVPLRPQWQLLQGLGHSHVNDVWLARDGNKALCVFKFSALGSGLAALRREVTLSRLLHRELPESRRFARVLDWNFAQPPFFIQCAYGGLDLLEWATQHGGIGLVPRALRLRLLADVADAVADAHDVGILHKDLKPANILVHDGDDHQPEICLTDFGSGHLLQPERLAALGITQAGFTQIGDPAERASSGAGTLPYLPPEVIAGYSPTLLADVYALGVMLYQMLAGDFRKPLASGWEHDIDDELLRGDIAAATHGDPQRRLPSAREFAGRLRDLEQRHAQLAAQRAAQRAAEQRQVEAQRLVEHARARRPWLLATAAALAIGVGAVAFLYAKTLQASHEAQRNAATADAVNRFFNRDVLGAASPYAGLATGEPTIRDAIDYAVGRIDAQLADQPLVEATVRMTIGQVYGEAMQIAKAIEQDRQAVRLFETHVGIDDRRTQQARYRLALDLIDASGFDEAWQLLEGTDALRRSLRLDDPETRLLSQQAHCYFHIWREQYEAAQPACEGVIATQLEFDPHDGPALIKARANLAVVHSRAGRGEAAEVLFRQLQGDFAGRGPRNDPMRLRFDYLHGMNLLGLKRYDEAAALLDAALRGTAAALGADNPHTLEVMTGLGELYARTGRYQRAAETLRIAYLAYARQLGRDNFYTLATRRALGHARCRAGARGDGITELQAAHQGLLLQNGAHHPQTQYAALQLAQCLVADARPGEAAALLRDLRPASLQVAAPELDLPTQLVALRARLPAADAGDGGS